MDRDGDRERMLRMFVQQEQPEQAYQSKASLHQSSSDDFERAESQTMTRNPSGKRSSQQSLGATEVDFSLTKTAKPPKSTLKGESLQSMDFSLTKTKAIKKADLGELAQEASSNQV